MTGVGVEARGAEMVARETGVVVRETVARETVARETGAVAMALVASGAVRKWVQMWVLTWARVLERRLE